MTHGKKDGIIYSSDGEFCVNNIWENFTGNNCPTLVGKPKLFFVQACRGTMTDPGILFRPKPRSRLNAPADTVDSKSSHEDKFVIPVLADLLVMYSTAEGYYSFRNPSDGSWFIQALCQELCENPHEELMTILTSVNRRVAYAKQSYVPNTSELDACKQMPIIQSMLTKSLYFLNRDQKESLKRQSGL
jgi:caspase 7